MNFKSVGPGRRPLTFRKFKQFNNDFAPTYEEYIRNRSTRGPINASQAYENIMTNKREKFDNAPVNTATYTNAPQTRNNPLYDELLKTRNLYQSFNVATGMRRGEWKNKYAEGNYPTYSNYPNICTHDCGGECKSCSVTAEPLDQNNYDAIYNEQSTPLKRAYFSNKNINFIRWSISQIFKKKYNLPLGLQPYVATESFMFLIANDLICDMDQDCGEGSRNFNILNTYTLQELEKRIYKNLNYQFGYQNWVQKATTTVQIQNPIYTRANDKTISLSKYYNGCEYQS
jgi:hypothetical protein